MIYNILGKAVLDRSVVKLIQQLREDFLAAGGDPLNFPEYLKLQGVSTVNEFIVVEDDFVTMATLKFA